MVNDVKIAPIGVEVKYINLLNKLTMGCRKPYGKNIRCYDVNSLYPYIMRNINASWTTYSI